MIKPRTQWERSVVVVDVVLVVAVADDDHPATATTFCGYRGIVGTPPICVVIGSFLLVCKP